MITRFYRPESAREFMTLKEAREKGKLAQFIREKEKEQKPADAARFKKVVRVMVSPPVGSPVSARRKRKPTPGTSQSDSSAS